ncbi:MAG: hypothetical protein C4520_14360 [Candidatus Abyssobacteria bacterium SURF_5]|uniref:Uncharacterized protein n=1 Tax=Abyssobacteria bacterium (strain SURF_5) TaxID=2093360 RepID=A0A3A4NK08_ABYX5|nr:MAG: hypothetical protein C4520_14360 [Candidatus Abyssubacteria bacterium SURF_5]
MGRAENLLKNRSLRNRFSQIAELKKNFEQEITEVTENERNQYLRLRVLQLLNVETLNFCHFCPGRFLHFKENCRRIRENLLNRKGGRVGRALPLPLVKPDVQISRIRLS